MSAENLPEPDEPSKAVKYVYQSDINCPELAARLRSRYPGIRILECYQASRHNNVSVGLNVRFQAPRKELIEAGLATERMFRHRHDLRTEFGEHCGLYAKLDAQSRAGCWDLMISRDVETRDDLRADGMAVTKKLQREVAIMIRSAKTKKARP